MSHETVASAVVGALREIGVTHVFGVPSGGWVDYMEAMRQTDGIEFVLTSHEGGAGFMADVYGRLTGIPGVCFGTYGPGATNLSTGVGSALLDRSPMIALTDEMPAHLRGRTVQMGIDHQALFRPLTKMTTRLEASRVRNIVFDACLQATSGRPGPVHIGLPTDISGSPAVQETTAHWPQPRPAADDPVFQPEMQTLFASARKPVLVAGLAAANERCASKIRAMAEKHALPVLLTPMAKGVLPHDHPCYAGVLFHALSDVVGQVHQQADLVISIGYDPVEFNYEAWMPTVPIISISGETADIDRSQYNGVHDVVGDIEKTLDHMMDTVCEPKEWDLSDLAAHRTKLFGRLSSDPTKTFGPLAALETLRNVLPDDGIMTCDVGSHTHLIGQKWPTPKPGLQLMTNGWSAMGFGIPSAIAAKICRPQTPVCAVLGDGGFLMSAGELAVAARRQLNIVFVLLSDNDLALIRIKQQKRQNPIYGTIVRDAGGVGGDSVFGVPLITTTDTDQFEGALKKAFASPGPTIVEAIVDSSEYDALVLRKDKP